MSDVWLSIVMVVAFVLIGGVFSGAEIALVSLRESQVRGMAESGGRRGKAVQRLLSDPNRFLAAVQVGVTLAGFFSAAFGASTLSQPLARWLVGRGMAEGLAGTTALVLVTIAISYLSLVAGELTPKRLALQRAEGFSLLVAAPLNTIATLSRPVIWLLSKSTDVLVRLLGGDPKVSGESISQEELRDLVAAHESLSSDERRLIDEVFRAGEREVREVMTPRTEVAFLDASMTASRAAKQVADSNWSRFPVVGRDEDDVVGFVHVRDLFLPNHPAGRAATVGDLSREVKRLPGTAGVLTALSEMRRGNQHLAIVVDEYGGTDGIVTLEDLIEEVIGEIYDEYDEEVVADGRQPADGPREVDGLLNLDDFTEATGLELPEGPYETVAGYVLAELGRLPEVGDAIEVEGRRLTVLELDGRRIARLRVDPPPAPAERRRGRAAPSRAPRADERRSAAGLRHVPGVADDPGEVGVLRRPAQLGADAVARGDQLRGVAGPPRTDDDRHRVPGHLARRVDDLLHGEAGAVAEVVDAVLAGRRCRAGRAGGRRPGPRRARSRGCRCRRASGSPRRRRSATPAARRRPAGPAGSGGSRSRAARRGRRRHPRR